jgi:hypothetical protein
MATLDIVLRTPEALASLLSHLVLVSDSPEPHLPATCGLALFVFFLGGSAPPSSPPPVVATLLPRRAAARLAAYLILSICSDDDESSLISVLDKIR